jgi:predicted MFS family arabinose efflux permease
MCLPTAFSIITDTFPTGKRRNIAFACLGLGQPLGWSVGLIIGGVCEGTPLGWRFAFYMTAALAMLLGCANAWKLPEDRKREPFILEDFLRSVDWIGLLISSSCLGAFSYVFA